MGSRGLEPPTSRLSGVRSNQLSYNPLHTVLYISQSAGSFLYKSGSHLLSHTVSSIVSSAAEGLTIVFGMCTGVSPKRIATRRMSCGTQAIMELLRNSLWTNTLVVELIAYSQGCPWQLNRKTISTSHSFERGILFLRKEVIQPHLPIRLPCYDFTPVIRPAFGGSFLR